MRTTLSVHCIVADANIIRYMNYRILTFFARTATIRGIHQYYWRLLIPLLGKPAKLEKYFRLNDCGNLESWQRIRVRGWRISRNQQNTIRIYILIVFKTLRSVLCFAIKTLNWSTYLWDAIRTTCLDVCHANIQAIDYFSL